MPRLSATLAALTCATFLATPEAEAEPDQFTCSALRPALSEATDGVHSIEDPATGKIDPKALDPKQGADKIKAFLDHLRLAAALANDASEKLDDPDKAARVEDFATALNAYVASATPVLTGTGPAGKSSAPTPDVVSAAGDLKTASNNFADLVRDSCDE